MYYYYNGEDNSSQAESSGATVSNVRINTKLSKDSKKEPEAEVERTRMLLAVNELYGFSLVYFLPNIRSRVRTLVDVSHAIRKLKELKNDSSEEARDLKVTMWDEINLSAFSSLVVTVYSLAAVSILLRVQMHILVRDASRMGDQEQPEEDIFYELMEGSYKHLFGEGMEALATRVKALVGAKLREGDWNVESRMSVEFEEVNELLALMRTGMEGDGEGLSSLVDSLFFPRQSEGEIQAESQQTSHEQGVQGEGNVEEGKGVDKAGTGEERTCGDEEEKGEAAQQQAPAKQEGVLKGLLEQVIHSILILIWCVFVHFFFLSFLCRLDGQCTLLSSWVLWRSVCESVSMWWPET